MAYKDSLFRSIFGNKASALALYNAVQGTNLDVRDTGIVINTLNETLWTPRKNDLSFLVDRRLVVIAEHQSTINENMPYRMLQYVCRLFENSLEDKKAVYRQKPVRHPRPWFAVLLNGNAEFPDHKKLRLSDSFEPSPDLGFGGIALELEIDVYNINDGRNRSILESCGELKGYAFFVARAKLHERELKARNDVPSRGEITLGAIRLAIRDCRNAGLLTEFWDKMSQEEINMLANEWDMETALEVRREEGFEDGVERGVKLGLERGVEQGVEKTALNALAEGLPMGVIQKITGLDTETITGLAQRFR